ncbi:MAG: hypothetical protein K6A38_01120 [Lachnospiraceae bacterium]|nr:hypothetical protein [Lachnospiraceae bacterium]
MNFKATLKKTIAVVLSLSLMYLTTGVDSNAVTSSGSIARGIDVSKYQGVIDWSAVAKSGIKFAFIRVGSTYSGIDPTFDYNMRSAQANGIKTGVYIYSYATNAEQAAMEAALVTQWLAPYQVQLPVVFDIEDKTQTSLPNAEINNIINSFCIIMDAAGYYPMVYSYKNYFQGKIGATPWDKWVAQYNDSLDYPTPAFWQNTSKGSVPGIKGNVDMDYQYKDYSKLIIKDGFLDHNGSKRYYKDYKMQTGWVMHENSKYFFDVYGYIVKGWYVDVDGKMYYLNTSDGKASIGATQVDNFTFYFDPSGAMQYGFIDYGKGMKYFDPLMNGAMATTWFAYNGKMFYALEDGTVATGYQEVEGVPYFFEEDGSMAIGKEVSANKKTYMAGADGVLVELVPIADDGTGEGPKKLDAETMAAMNGIDLSTLNEAQLAAFMTAVDNYNALIP